MVRRLRVRSMPPAGLPRPDEGTYLSLIASLESSLDRAAAAHPNPGRTETFRRLNRTEYHNAVRDLLALEVDVAPLLPSDDASYGFDNVTVGDLSPTLLERYVSAAQQDQPAGHGQPDQIARRRHHRPAARSYPGEALRATCRWARAAGLRCATPFRWMPSTKSRSG